MVETRVGKAVCCVLDVYLWVVMFFFSRRRVTPLQPRDRERMDGRFWDLGLLMTKCQYRLTCRSLLSVIVPPRTGDSKAGAVSSCWGPGGSGRGEAARLGRA